ncbi:hypothetical protein AtEden1_Chr5g0151181 [Arabidopsis thaliana]|uniref:Uncharacterized protein n=1 Tax=Arabidopsis thaliana TaxID=3702 RepID=A0A5S9YGK2_ARATH|nr:unnamed protein product [Arabidopsis thaliana]
MSSPPPLIESKPLNSSQPNLDGYNYPFDMYRRYLDLTAVKATAQSSESGSLIVLRKDLGAREY